MKLILFFICLITFLFMGQSIAQQNINKLSTKELTVNGKVEVNSTTLSSKPCPAMTETQRNAIATPANGSCVYNTTTLQLNVYNGSIWKSAGGGISNWETAFNYAIGDVVIESNKIYQANTAHTSTVFASQLSNWTQIANNVSDVTGVVPLVNGGTNKNTPASAGSVVYSDADSFELTSVGTSGQVLKSNGAGAPAFAISSIKAKAQNLSQVDADEIQAHNNQLTETASGKHLIETGNLNLLQNPGFEHTTFSTGWTTTGTTATLSAETVTIISGLKAIETVASSQNISIVQDSTLYASQIAGMQGYVQMSCSNTAPNVKICARGAGVTSTTDCVTLATDGAWKQYEIPVVLSATSNGISVAATSTTGTTICDDAYVGLISGKTPEVSQAVSDNLFANSITYSASTSGLYKISSSITTNASNGILRVDNSGASTRFYCDKDCKFIIGYSAVLSGGSANLYLSVNGGGAVYYSDSGAAATWRNLSANISLLAGQYVSIGGTSTVSSGELSVVAIYNPPASKIYSQQCQNNPTSCENTFSATVNTSAVVTSQTLDWITSCSGTTTKTCNFKSGLFTTTPNCQNTAIHGGNNFYYGNITSVSTTQILIQGYRSDSSIAVNTPLSFSCQKTGADFKAQNVITGTFAEMMKVPGVSKPIIFGFENTSLCSSGTCITREFGVDTTSIFSSTGVYTTSVPSEVCSNTPFCVDGTGSAASSAAQCKTRGSSSTSITTICATTVVTNELFGAICICQAP